MKYTVTMTYAKPPQFTLKIEAYSPGQARRIAAAESESCGFGRPRKFDIREEN